MNNLAFAALLVVTLAPSVIAAGAAPAGYAVAVQGKIDNKTGGTLAVTDPQSPLYGAAVAVRPGALILPVEELTLSYSKALPAPTRRLEGGLAMVQRSYSFILQTESGSVALPVELDLPYFRAGAEPTDADVVPWDLWDVERQAYDSLSASPILGKPGFSRVLVRSIYPGAVYVALDVTQAQGGLRGRKFSPDSPKGWQKIPDEDDCLAAGPPQPRGRGKKTTFEIRFTNRCDYPIQGSVCDGNTDKPCKLPNPTVLLPGGEEKLVLRTAFQGAPVNSGACRMALPDGTKVRFYREFSSHPGAQTMCLVREDESKEP
jgi:hypothetical protein